MGFAGETWPSNRKTAESSCAPWKTAPAAVLEHTDVGRHLAREVCTPVPVQDGVARVETWSFSGARTGTTILQDLKSLLHPRLSLVFLLVKILYTGSIPKRW